MAPRGCVFEPWVSRKSSMVDTSFPYRIIAQFPTAEAQCQSRRLLPIDMIFTDIVGLTQFKRKVRSGYGKFRYHNWPEDNH